MTDLFILLCSKGSGGVTRVSILLQNKLPLNISRKFISLFPGMNKYPISGEEDIICNVKRGRVGIKSYISVFYKYIRYLKAENPKVVLSFITGDNILNLLSSLFLDIIPIISLHGNQINAGDGFGKIVRRIVALLVRIIPKAKVIAINNGLKEQYHQYYKVPYDKIQLIYNPVDITTVIEQSLSSKISPSIFMDDTPVIISVGNLNPVKSQWHLIRAFAEVRKKYLCHLLICGAGEEACYLKSLVAELGIENEVYFIGWQKNPYKFMARSTMLVLPSISEGLPTVLIEAMASGCPVISSDCGAGVREIIGNHNEFGLLAEKMTGTRYQVNDPLDAGELSLLVHIQKLIEDKALREEYIKRGKERAIFFSLEKGINEYYEFILNQIRQHHSNGR